MRSLKIAENEGNNKDEDSQDKDGKDKYDDSKVDWYQVKKEREWDKRYCYYTLKSLHSFVSPMSLYQINSVNVCI